MNDSISRRMAMDAFEERLDYLQMFDKDENLKAESKGVNWARITIAALPSAEVKTKCIAQIKVDTEELVRRIKEEYLDEQNDKSPEQRRKEFEEWKRSIKEEKMKNFNDNIVRRIEKAFPELDRDEILDILTNSDTYVDALDKCIKETESVPASRYYVVIAQLKDGYPCEKLEFLSYSDMLEFYYDTVRYFKNHISKYGCIDVCTLKDYFKEQCRFLYTESYLYEKFVDSDYGWKRTLDIKTYDCGNTKVIYFADPVNLY